jgi:glutathione synthase
MKLLFVMDPLARLQIAGDSTFAMMLASQARGHEIWFCEPRHLSLEHADPIARAWPVTVRRVVGDHYLLGPQATVPLRSCQAVFMRKDPPFDLEYVATTWLLSAAVREGARVFNSPDAIRDHNEKLAIAEFAPFVAPTLVTRAPERIQAFIDEQQDVVLKRLDVMGGENIFRVRVDDPNRNVIVEVMAQGGRRMVMAQRYIPEISAGDNRVLLIDGQPVPFALARIPKAGESRGNLAAGARGVAQPLSARQREIATAVGPVLAKRGLLVVGLDIIGDWLTEVNVTSPTCFREIQDQSGYDVAGTFITALEKQLK